jgi:GNAT superfamily N-acetyltransferase
MNAADRMDWKLARLVQDSNIKYFECADKDLNDFLLNDAKNYLNSMLAVTYVIQNDEETIAYFSLSNDNLSKNDEESSVWNKLNRKIPNEKRRHTYPAVKIGRLAVSEKYQGKGFGTHIIFMVQEMYIHEMQRAGCRFMTVDAYRDALPFYEKNKFKFLTEQDCNDDTRTMYFDLKAI